MAETRKISLGDLPRLFAALVARGYTPVGPTVKDGAIVYDEIDGVQQLPVGITDVQNAGSYRLEARSDGALFGYAVGPHSWKKFLFPSRERLFAAHREGKSFVVEPEPFDGRRLAFIGVRACELAAIAVQDRVFAGIDGRYEARRKNVLIVAVNCGQAGGTCFCDSMGNGPRAQSGFDLVLTEVVDASAHYFVVASGSAEGQAILDELPTTEATPDEAAEVDRAESRARAQMGRKLDTQGIKELLYRNYEHPRWDDVASRCLTCANCTLACPTCFCSTVSDTTDLTGDHAERWKTWDSCFTQDFSHVHGGSVRPSTRSRYRQWMTHKLATWIDQFGTSGCVGCGRCITWCPVGIDITEEVAAIRASEAPESQSGGG